MHGEFNTFISQGKLTDVYAYCPDKQKFIGLQFMIIGISKNPDMFLNKIIMKNIRFAKYLMSISNKNIWVLNPFEVNVWPSIGDVF